MLRITVLIVFSAFPVFVGFAQEPSLPITVTLHFDDITFEEAVRQLTIRYGISFYYSSSKIPVHHKVHFHADEVSLTDLLDNLCAQAGMSYRVNDNQVIFFLTSRQEAEKVCIVSGYVVDSATGERLIGATIAIPELMKGTTSNAFGYYSYSLPPDTYRIQCSFIGYAVVERTVILDSHQVVSFSLKSQVQEIPEAKLRLSLINRIEKFKSGTERIPTSLLKIYPALLGENDVIQFLKMMPGVQTTTEGLNGLYVRGSLPQHTSFLIDDAPMFNMFHLSGWFSTINPDAINEVTLYKSHLPAKTGGSLGSIVDIRLRDGNNQHFHLTGGIGTITSRLTFEGPIIRNKSSFILSARRTYIDQVIKLLNINDNVSNIFFYDLNAKFNFMVNHQNRLYVSSYVGRDIVDESNGTVWGNSLVSARWNHLFSERAFSNLTLTGSWYNHSFNGHDDEDNPYRLVILLRSYSLKYDLTRYMRTNNKINTGLRARYTLLPPTRIEGDILDVNQINDYKKAYAQLLTTAYLQDEFTITGHLSADAAIRITLADKLYPNDTKISINPEPILSFRYGMKEEITLNAAYTRNYQYYHGASVFELIIPFDRYLLAGAKLKPQYADHFSAGFFYSPSHQQFDLSLEPYFSFYRNQYRIPVSEEVYLNRDAEVKPVNGKLNTYGVEASFKKLTGKFTGMISYTWAKAKKQEEGINQNRFFYPYYDRRHDFVINLNYQIAPRILLSSNWVYMSGNPYSFPIGKYELRGRSIPLYDSSNLYNRRMPDYHRLDVSVRFSLGKKIPSRHSLTVMVYNVYARKNPIFYSYRDVADGNIENNPDSGYTKRLFSMMGYYFFNIFPAFSYEFKFGK